jgi:hypothetical protein
VASFSAIAASVDRCDVLQPSFIEKLEKIRVQFLFDHPFLSVLALSIPHKYQNNPHMLFETDGVSIRVDESKMMGYDDTDSNTSMLMYCSIFSSNTLSE